MGFQRDTVIFLQAGNSAVYGVDETLRVSFAHQNASRSGDGEERDTMRNNRRSVADRLPTPNAIYMNVRCYI